MTDRRIKAIGLISGGLDSTLAARVLLEQGIDVVGLHFSTGFCMNDHRRALARPDEEARRMRNEGLRAGADLGIPVEVLDAGEAYLRMVLKPKHGYGRFANPCIDCRIFMIHGAADYLREHGGDFVFTGEVLGQRPMSQHMQAMRTIERECGIEGFLLRPLSAQHMPETEPEKRGWVDRGRLLAISGRSRKEQTSLAERFGLSDFPQPSGGCCFLADENFARRFHDKRQHGSPETIRKDEIILLKVGRHFRLNPEVKIIVARDASENRFLERFTEPGWRFEALDCGSPITLTEGEPDEATRRLIASITARYSDRRNEPLVEVSARRGDHEERLMVPPVADSALEAFRL
ncbi:MAG TPA: thiamine biosynthesis protein [Candidatus Polarisedimenticolia bacterium]|jgi:tRNA U34 2-thiouridine synthase MnmA/TrmU|nr:thiamine biosynthesis protein [Candidatus Polarisedimenticolia bacterium]